jgi:hypothetical protein
MLRTTPLARWRLALLFEVTTAQRERLGGQRPGWARGGVWKRLGLTKHGVSDIPLCRFRRWCQGRRR